MDLVMQVPRSSPEATRVRAALVERLWEEWVLTRPEVQAAFDDALVELADLRSR